jgi:hypothetical protein
MATVFSVLARHDGQAWAIRIEDDEGKLVGGTSATTLEQVDDKARAVVAGYVGLKPDALTLAIEIQLDPAIQYRLDTIAELRQAVGEQAHLAEHDMTDAGISPRDIGAMLGETVTNQEIAAHGLRRYPQAVAVRFDDRGRFATTTCRACLERDRLDYGDLPPEGVNTLLFRGPLMCDVCFDDIPSRD